MLDTCKIPHLQWCCSPMQATSFTFSIHFCHTQHCTAVSRTSEEWSAHCRGIYLTTHNTHNRHTSMPLAGFEPTLSADKWLQTCPLDCKATETRSCNILKKKKKWSRYGPGVAQRVGRGIALLFHDRGTRRGWVVSSTRWPHFTPGKDPVPILQESGWAPGPVWTGGNISFPPGFDFDRPACSQLLYRLSYLAHKLYINIYIKYW